MGRFLFLIGELPLIHADEIDHNAPRPAPVSKGVTKEYGKYLSVIAGCIDCHGENLGGQHVPGTPPDFPDATDISPSGIGKWTEEGFIKSLTEGLMPDGTAIDPFMPWAVYTNMTLDEKKALWLYLKSVPPATR